MPLFVAFLSFKPGSSLAQGMAAFERRKTFQHPPRARLLGEYWVAAPPDKPQVVLVWEADDDGPGDYYEAAWGDLFDITVCRATRPVTELPADLGGLATALGAPSGTSPS
ncbi:hypothetical protein HRbin29_00429 [bacterium HR29]|jgi:hypothetical protein|nr:hypothetical protein HRbin29_00429 [bacterium HR29]